MSTKSNVTTPAGAPSDDRPPRITPSVSDIIPIPTSTDRIPTPEPPTSIDRIQTSKTPTSIAPIPMAGAHISTASITTSEPRMYTFQPHMGYVRTSSSTCRRSIGFMLPNPGIAVMSNSFRNLPYAERTATVRRRRNEANCAIRGQNVHPHHRQDGALLMMTFFWDKQQRIWIY